MIQMFLECFNSNLIKKGLMETTFTFELFRNLNYTEKVHWFGFSRLANNSFRQCYKKRSLLMLKVNMIKVFANILYILFRFRGLNQRNHISLTLCSSLCVLQSVQFDWHRMFRVLWCILSIQFTELIVVAVLLWF